MRITHLYKHYLPHPGGVERAMHALARGLAAEGHSVRAIVASGSTRGSRRHVDGVAVIGVPTFGSLWSMPIAPGLLSFRPIDGEVLHVHESFPLATLAAFLRLRRRERAAVVVTWHFDVVRQRAFAPLHRLLASRVLERASAIHVTTDLLAARSPALRPFAGKVRVIPHIVDVERFRRMPDHPLARRIRVWAADAPVALFVGRLVYYKGLDVLLEALALVPGVRAAIVGSGPLERMLRKRARAARVDDRVLWLGQVADGDLVGAYSGADLFVLPSTAATETFGVVQVEAMAAGLPVIATRLGTGVERVGLEEVTGRSVEPGDASALAAAIAQLTTDAALRGRLSSGALERSRDFAAARLMPLYRAMYSEVRS